MSTLLYGFEKTPVPNDEANVRSTVTTVQMDAPSSMQPDSPDYNETVTDPITEGGLTGHQMASKVTPPRREGFAPENASEDLFTATNKQVSSSGTAAAREASGTWGHGSLNVVEGIEPVLVEGHAFNEDYFKADERPIQDSMGNYMTPAHPADPGTRAAAQSEGEQASREAVARSMYAAYYQSVTG